MQQKMVNVQSHPEKHGVNKTKSQMQRHRAMLDSRHSVDLPLLRELSALSRAPSLRDPSTSSTWKSPPPSSHYGSTKLGRAAHRRELEESDDFMVRNSLQEHALAEEEEEEEDELKTGWEDKIVNWIGTGLREGDRKQELLRSIDELMNSKGESPADKSLAQTNPKYKKAGSTEQQGRERISTIAEKPAQKPRRRHGRQKDTSGSNRRAAKLSWKEDDASYAMREGDQEDGNGFEESQNIEQALALSRHARFKSEADIPLDYGESDSTSEDDLRSHSQSPLLGRDTMNKDRRARRVRKPASGDLGCANFRYPLSSQERHPCKAILPHRSNEAALPDDLDGPESNHGCGLPWYWSRQKGKNLLEIAGRSLSCGYAELPRRKSSGQEIIPAGFTTGISGTGINPAVHKFPFLAGKEMYGGSSQLDMEQSSGKRHRSLSQKYRPKTFREVVGQNMLVQALSNAVSMGRIAPVYLFHGPRGTGKTSSARILAALLNCISVEDLRPCGVCRECLLLCLGKTTDVKEVDVASQNATSNMRILLNDVALPPSSGRYKVFIIDECHNLTPEAWNAFLKCLEEPPEHAVFILITTDPEKLPHPATTRCQKFHFPKIKDCDIVSRLQKLALKENMEVETDALELIAARSSGSLRDAETTLDQLSLVGQNITLEVVQELVGLISNAKLAELLDLALTGDTLSTVKCIREFMDAGVEPLALMSQIATLITDILAGGYMPSNEKGFFQKHILTKDQLEKLRQALKTLCESEKQIRSSHDQTTWLTAALLQFAPDLSSVFPISSAGTSASPSIMAANDTSEKETIEWEPGPIKQTWDNDDGFESQQLNSLGAFSGMPDQHFRNSNSVQMDVENNRPSFSSRQDARTEHPQSLDDDRIGFERQQKLKDTWVRVLEASNSNILKQLLWNHAKLLSISIEGGRAVAYIEFQQPEHRSSAERSKTSISHAFQTVLGFPVEIRLSLAGDSNMKPKCNARDEQKSMFLSDNALFPPTECKAPLYNQQTASPAKAGGMASVPHTEYLNSRSLPAFTGRGKVDTTELSSCRESKGSWEHGLEEFPSLKSFSSGNQSDQEGRASLKTDAALTNKACLGYVIHQSEGSTDSGRQNLQQTGRRFKLRTIRNLSTDSGPLTSEGGKAPASNPDYKSSKLGSRAKHGSLLCWKANKVDEDEEEASQDKN